MAERIIRKITQTIPSLPQIKKQVEKRKVAAYARVSTASAEQENSLAAQRDYFYKLIQRHEDWCFVEVYYDDDTIGYYEAQTTEYDVWRKVSTTISKPANKKFKFMTVYGGI